MFLFDNLNQQMKLINTFLLLLMVASVLTAQSNAVLETIPQKDLIAIGSMTPHSTFQKLDKERREEYNVASSMASLVLMMTQSDITEAKTNSMVAKFENPEATGLQVKENVFFWIKKAVDPDASPYSELPPMYYQLVIPVLDWSKLDLFMQELFADKAGEFLQIGNAKNVMHNGILINWNKKRLVICQSSATSSFYEEDEVFEARREAILKKQANALGNEYTKAESVMSDPQFVEHLQKKADISVWVNYDALMDEAVFNEVPREGRATVEALVKKFSGYKLGGHIRVEQDEIVIDYESYYSETTAKIMRSANSKTGNKKLLKYVDSENLIGMYSMSFDVENYTTTFNEEIYSVLNTTKEGKLVVDMINIIDIFVDEEEIYSLWNGDMIVAVTGVDIIEKEYKRSSYDDETGEYLGRIKDTMKTPMPIGLMGIAFDGDENIKKFIKLGVDAGVISKRADGVYAVGGSMDELGREIFIIMNKGVLLFTNDETLADQRKGVARKKRIQKEDCKKATSSMVYAFLDVKKGTSIAQELEAELGGELPNDLDEWQKIERLELIVKPTKGNSTEAELHFKFNEEGSSAIEGLIELSQGVMRNMMMGGRGRRGSGSSEWDEFDELEELDPAEDTEEIKRL